MSRFIRPSKYRHVYGQSAKRENCIDNLKVSGNAWDTNIIATSGKYCSINWASSGGGAFAILPAPSPLTGTSPGFPSRLPDIVPLARQHSAPVLDTAWSPFDDSIVASGGEDGNVFIWKISDDAFEGWGAEKWVPIDFDPVESLHVSARKVGQVVFHPTAQHIIATATGDHVVKLWDLGNTDAPRSVLPGHGDTIQSIAFNYTGTLMVTTCRDRKLRIFDARTGGDAVRIADGHSGIKGARVTWMGDKDNIATTGFSKMSDREVAVWETGSLSVIKRQSVDQSAGVMMPYYCDNGILFLGESSIMFFLTGAAFLSADERHLLPLVCVSAGKGDGNIRYYEWESDTLYPLAEHKSTEPQRGICFLPRRALNVSECEIARAYKLTTTAVEPITFIVPRKADTFQPDIYPHAQAAEPALTAGEFFTGKAVVPKLYEFGTSTVFSSSSSASSLPPPPTKTATASAPVPAAVPAPAFTSSTTSSTSPSVQPTSTSPTVSKYTSQAQEVSSPSVLSPPGAVPVAQKEDPFSNGNPSTKSTDSGAAALREENAQLNQELRDARSQIRELELQVETLRNNAQKAAKALLG